MNPDKQSQIDLLRALLTRPQPNNPNSSTAPRIDPALEMFASGFVDFNKTNTPDTNDTDTINYWGE
jgi:hypothetical protein